MAVKDFEFNFGQELTVRSLTLTPLLSDFVATGSGGEEYIHTLLEPIDASKTMILVRNFSGTGTVANQFQILDDNTISLSGQNITAAGVANVTYRIELISGLYDVIHHVSTENAGANNHGIVTTNSNLLENLEDREKYKPFIACSGAYVYDRVKGQARISFLYDMSIIDNGGIDAVQLKVQKLSLGGTTYIPIQLIRYSK